MKNKQILFISLLAFATNAQTIINPEQFLKWKHSNKDTANKNAPIQRFDILVKYLGGSEKPPILAFQSMVSPDDVGEQTYFVKIINIFRDISFRGDFEIKILAHDIYGFASDLSLPLLVNYDPAAPQAAFDLIVE